MSFHSFQPGERVRLHGVEYVIQGPVGATDTFELRNTAVGGTRSEPIAALIAAYDSGSLTFIDGDSDARGRTDASKTKTFGRPLADMSEATKRSFSRKREYLRRLDDRGALVFNRRGTLELATKAIASEIHDPHPPSRSTLHRWYLAWKRSDSSHRGLVPRFDRCGATGVGRLPDLVESVMVEAIDGQYLTEQRLSAVEVYASVVTILQALNKERLDNEQLPIPSLRSFQRRIASLNRYERMARREGSRAAKRHFRNVTGMVKVDRILERVEMDHTPLNLFVIDGKTGLPLGRPDLTVAIDYRSRMCLGYFISFHGHGADAVLQCLRHAIMSKSYMKERFPEVMLWWPAMGLPSVLVVDNGLEFMGYALAAACQELGIDLQFMPKRRPDWKGTVERFLKTFAHQFIHRLPGTTFHSIKARGDYDPNTCAVVTMQDLERWIHSWICDEYHNTRHRGLLQRPVDAWTESALKYPPPMVADVRQLDFALGEAEERTLWHYGISLFGTERYNSPELGRMFAQLDNVRVRVRYQRANIGKIFVEHPISKEFIEVPNVDPEYAQGLTLLQHEIIRSSQRTEAEGRVDRAALLQSKARIQEETRKLLLSKNLRDRRAGVKRLGLSGQHGDSTGSNVLTRFHDAQQAEADASKKSRARKVSDAPTSPQAPDGPPLTPAERPLTPRPLLPARRFNTRPQGDSAQ